MKSLVSDAKICWVCGRTTNLHRHHIYGGVGRRKLSEEYGCWVYLCAEHHNMSDEGVHFNHALDLMLKKECQNSFEQTHTREEFRRIFNKSYL